jgi:hypothetical protein
MLSNREEGEDVSVLVLQIAKEAGKDEERRCVEDWVERVISSESTEGQSIGVLTLGAGGT